MKPNNTQTNAPFDDELVSRQIKPVYVYFQLMQKYQKKIDERKLEAERKLEEKRKLDAEQKLVEERKLEAERKLEEKLKLDAERKLFAEQKLEEKRKLEKDAHSEKIDFEPKNKKIKLKSASEKKPSVELRFDRLDHLPDIDEKANASRCKNIGCAKKTHIYCTKCNLHLCLTQRRNCFKLFHTDSTNSLNSDLKA